MPSLVRRAEHSGTVPTTTALLIDWDGLPGPREEDPSVSDRTPPLALGDLRRLVHSGELDTVVLAAGPRMVRLRDRLQELMVERGWSGLVKMERVDRRGTDSLP